MEWVEHRSQGRTTHILTTVGPDANSDCKGAILPTEDLFGEMSWDTSRYLPIAQVGQQINHYCVEAMGLPISGTGGIDRVGKQCILQH